jgi:hypothetical protein
LDKETREIYEQRLTSLQARLASLDGQLAELQKRLGWYEQREWELANKSLQTGITSKLDVA